MFHLYRSYKSDMEFFSLWTSHSLLANVLLLYRDSFPGSYWKIVDSTRNQSIKLSDHKMNQLIDLIDRTLPKIETLDDLGRLLKLEAWT